MAFKRSLASKEPPLGLSPAVAALWWSGKDEWNKAHEIVMDRDDPDCAWVHAYLRLRAISAGTPFARTRRSRGGRTAIAATLLPDSAAQRDLLNWPPVSLAMPPSTSPPNRSPMRTEIASIYAAAEIGSFQVNGAPTAIFKKPVNKVEIGREGISATIKRTAVCMAGRKRPFITTPPPTMPSSRRFSRDRRSARARQHRGKPFCIRH